MKHFTKPDGSIWAFESDGSQDRLITRDMTPISDAALAVLRAPAFADQQAAELADFRNKREAYLNRVAGIGFAAQQAGDAVTVAAAVAVRSGLLDLPAHPTVTAATDIDGLKLAIRTRYAEIVGGLPAAAKAAFRKVDA
jgi:hypothetical protein